MFLLLLLLSWTSAACTVVPTPSVLKIGLVAPFEGRYRYVGYDAIYAARLAVREINAAGGVAGHKLALVAYDDRNDPALARDVARNLSLDPDVIAVIGHYRQATTFAARPHYAEHDLPLLVVGAWLTSPHASANQLAPPLTRLAEAMVAAVPPDALEGCGVIWGEDVLAASLARTLPAPPCPPGTDPSFALSSAPPHVAGARLQTQRSAGWPGVLVGGPDLGAPDFVAVAGADRVEGQRFLTPYPFPEDLPDTQAWRQAYESMGPHVPEPWLYALPTYEAIYLLADALAAESAAHPSPSRWGMARALREISRQGKLGSIRLDAQGVWPEAPLYLYVWRDGAPHLADVVSP